MSRAMAFEASPTFTFAWSPPWAIASVTQQLRCSSRRATAQDSRGSDLKVRSGPESYRKARSRRLLVTTNTDEKAIAAPAIIGLSSPAAASGIAATL